ncbi:hypothetical protein DsansV1_C02g0014481 [Dioscorea sansibarensis]
MHPGLYQRQVLFVDNGHPNQLLNHGKPTRDPTSNNVHKPHHIPAEELLSFQVFFQRLEILLELLHSLLQLLPNIGHYIKRHIIPHQTFSSANLAQKRATAFSCGSEGRMV